MISGAFDYVFDHRVSVESSNTTLFKTGKIYYPPSPDKKLLWFVQWTCKFSYLNSNEWFNLKGNAPESFDGVE